MLLSADAIVKTFRLAIADWHIKLSPTDNPFTDSGLENLLYQKAQIDTIQWHEEDEIRRPDLPIADLVTIKRNIDRLNQQRTDLVERVDDMIFNIYKEVERKSGARMNSETPAWLIDRMSILELKIWHMKEQTERKDVSAEHIFTCNEKLKVLLEQRKDMSQCLDELLLDISLGVRYFKVYRQMKMYNDKNLNPSLYTHKTT